MKSVVDHYKFVNRSGCGNGW